MFRSLDTEISFSLMYVNDSFSFLIISISLFLSLRVDLDSVPLYALDSKITQLRRLGSYFWSSSDSSHVDIKNIEISFLFDDIEQVMHYMKLSSQVFNLSFFSTKKRFSSA